MTIWFGDYPVPTQLASPTDYTNWSDQVPPANINPILRACTSLVLDATTGAGYDVDGTGVAIDTQTRNALRDMVCAQAAAWVALGIDPRLAGVTTTTVRTSSRLGSAAFTYDTADAAQASAARQAALTTLVPEAARIGRLNNLISYQPYGIG